MEGVWQGQMELLGFGCAVAGTYPDDPFAAGPFAADQGVTCRTSQLQLQVLLAIFLDGGDLLNPVLHGVGCGDGARVRWSVSQSASQSPENQVSGGLSAD